MTTAAELQSIAATLDTYRTHLAAVSHALGALRLVSEQLMRDLERDQAALATHIDLAAIPATAAAGSEAEEQPVRPPALRNSAAFKAGPAKSAIDACSDTENNHPDNADKTITIDEPYGAFCAATPKPAAPINPRAGKRLELKIEPDQQATSELQRTSPATVAAPTSHGANVVSLEAHRKQRFPRTGRRATTAVVTSFLLTAAAAYGSWQFMHTGMAQHLIELTACNSGKMSEHHDCTVLHI